MLAKYPIVHDLYDRYNMYSKVGITLVEGVFANTVGLSFIQDKPSLELDDKISLDEDSLKYHYKRIYTKMVLKVDSLTDR